MRKPAKKRTRRVAVQGVTQAEYARQKGVSREAIRKAVAAGRIPSMKGGRIDPRKADRALRLNTDPTKLRGRRAQEDDAPGPDGMPGLYQSRRKKAYHDARLSELEELRISRQLIPADGVRAAAFDEARKTRDHLDALTERVAPQFPEPFQSQLRTVLAAEIRRICEGLASPEAIVQAAVTNDQQQPAERAS